MKCPKCDDAELMVEIKDYETGTNKQDVDFVCGEGHKFFVRIKEEDLIEC